MKRKIAIQRIKIAIKRVQNRAAAFSKRRIGIFKEAAEFCQLTGAQIVIIAISPDDKHHVFGHPDADTVIDRFMGESETAVDTNSGGVVPWVERRCGESSGGNHREDAMESTGVVAEEGDGLCGGAKQED